MSHNPFDPTHYLTTQTGIGGTVTAQLVTADELRRIWMSPEATGMTDDEQSGHRIVHLDDGTAFATALSEIRGPAHDVDEDLVHTHLEPGSRPEGECPACDQVQRDLAASRSNS